MLPKTVAVTGVYKILSQSPAVKALVGDAIYARHAPPRAVMPYIILAYSWGGDDNRGQARGFDAYVSVKGLAATAGMADDIMGAVDSALVGTVPELPNGWVPWAPITATAIQEEGTIEVESKRFYTSGSQYRIRATKR